MTAGQNRIPVNLDYAASTPMRAEACLAQRPFIQGNHTAYGTGQDASHVLPIVQAQVFNDDVPALLAIG